MNRLVLANHYYSQHMTNEGLQLQEGLQHAGWTLAGPHYGDGERDVRRLILQYHPEAVFVQDKRDWDPDSGCPGATPDLKFQYLGVLSGYQGLVSVVVKDGGPDGSDYHEAFCRETKPSAVVLYYHPLSVLKYCPWLSQYKLVRTYHSVSHADVPPFARAEDRRPICGSGAMLSDVYPLRNRVAPRASEFGMVWLPHPGYSNNAGPDTPNYLSFLNSFKVHFATSSSYGFALRKIIESVACGCTVVTDLPTYDVLPEIDRAIIRVKPSITDIDLKAVLNEAVASWDESGRWKWAQKALRYYDYREVGFRLSRSLLGV